MTTFSKSECLVWSWLEPKVLCYTVSIQMRKFVTAVKMSQMIHKENLKVIKEEKQN